MSKAKKKIVEMLEDFEYEFGEDYPVFDTGGYELDPGHAVDLCIQLFTRSWEIHKAETGNNSVNKEEDEVPPPVVVDLIESEEKEPIQIGKRVLRDEDSVCTGRPPKIQRQNGMDPLTW